MIRTWFLYLSYLILLWKSLFPPNLAVVVVVVAAKQLRLPPDYRAKFAVAPSVTPAMFESTNVFILPTTSLSVPYPAAVVSLCGAPHYTHTFARIRLNFYDVTQILPLALCYRGKLADRRRNRGASSFLSFQ